MAFGSERRKLFLLFYLPTIWFYSFMYALLCLLQGSITINPSLRDLEAKLISSNNVQKHNQWSFVINRRFIIQIFMNLFFSPSVYSYQVLTPHFQVCEIVQKLIETNSVQFELNPYDDLSDPYFQIYTRIKSLKNKVTRMKNQIELKYHQNLNEMSNADKVSTIANMKQYMKKHSIDHLKYLDHQQYALEQRMSKFYAIAKNYDTFIEQQKKLEEQLDACRVKMQACKNTHIMEQFVIISGVCLNKYIQSLQRIIFRQTKGHSLISFKGRQNNTSTSVFLCLMNKNIYKHIGPKITKSCENNEVHLYDLPNVLKNLIEYQQILIKKIRQVDDFIEISGKQLTTVLHDCIVGEQTSLNQHILRVSYLERMIYIISHSKKIGNPANHILFTFHIPSTVQLPHLPAAIFPIQSSKIKKRTLIPRLNCLTEVNIMTQLFSIPKHNQIIPSIFMFTTVPILFGMMFSDFGHGLLLLLVSLLLKLNPIFYLMSFMSIYCGIIYNQFFGMKIIRWSHLGIVQPVWAVSENGLNFQNSLKMKISMIVAFFHMGFGMFLKIVNQMKRGQHKKIIYDSLPKIGILFTTVGYLVFLIVKKWLTNFQGHQSTAPSIINCLLQLYLGWNPARKHSIFSSIQMEHEIGQILNTITVCLILVMVYNHTLRFRIEQFLCYQFSPKRKNRNKHEYNQLNNQEGQQIDEQISEQLQYQSKQAYKSLKNQQQNYFYEAEDEHANQLGPLEVFQFVLGLISSTTSYLRLFALSLAHAKLSSLILDMLLSTLSNYHPYISLVRCVAFFCITIGMMLTLDVMQCLMHVVRLHWVEWMGKFYTGSGRLFNPEVQINYS